jgi:protein involved in polysaccharide export with SLBB domain
MTRLAPAFLVVLAACASSPASAPESAPMPAARAPRVLPPDSIPADDPGVLEPGDVLRIVVWRRGEFSGEMVVGPNGVLMHPLYQAVPVVGVPTAVVRERIGEFLSKYETNPQFTIELMFRVLATGEVRAPGLINVPQTTTIPQAIAVAGGPTADADMSNVKLLRGHQAKVFDLTSLGLVLDTLHVQSGDQIVVGKKFNFLRDYAGPIASLVTMFLAIGYYTRR